MENDLYIKVINLKEKIINSEEYKLLKKYDELLNNDEEVKSKYIELNNAKKEYEVLSKNLDCDKNILEIKQNNYLRLREEFYNMDIVKKYREYYKNIQELYDFINENLIYIFDKKIKND